MDGGQLAQQAVLGGVGVLVLVDEDVPPEVPVVVEDVRVPREELHRQAQEVVEVDRAQRPQPGRVPGVEPRHVGLARSAHALLDRLGPEELVLGARDPGDRRRGREDAARRARAPCSTPARARAGRPRRRSRRTGDTRGGGSRPGARARTWRGRWRPAGGARGRGGLARIAATRCAISPAALFVKVTARICRGSTPRATRYAIRCAMTRVLPLPAPARTSSGPVHVEDRLLLDRVQPGEQRRDLGLVVEARARLVHQGRLRDRRRRERGRRVSRAVSGRHSKAHEEPEYTGSAGAERARAPATRPSRSSRGSAAGRRRSPGAPRRDTRGAGAAPT